MSRNYYRKLSASIDHHTINVGIIGILAYPKKGDLFCEQHCLHELNLDGKSVKGFLIIMFTIHTFFTNLYFVLFPNMK